MVLKAANRILTAWLAVYFFITCSKEVGAPFDKAKDLKEEVLDIKNRTEERNKVLEGIGAEPARKTKTEE